MMWADIQAMLEAETCGKMLERTSSLRSAKDTKARKFSFMVGLLIFVEKTGLNL